MRISTSPIANHIFVVGEMEKMSVLEILKPRFAFNGGKIFGSLLTRLGLIPASIRERTQHCADVEVCTAILDLRIYIGSCSHVVC